MKGRSRSWLLLIAAVVLLVSMVVVVGCGGEEETTTTVAPETTTTAVTSSDTTDTTEPPVDEAMARAKAAVEKYSKVPAWEGPTEPLDTAALKGKVFYVLSADQNNLFNDTISSAVMEAAKLCGVEITRFDWKQTPALLNQYIMQGVDQKVDGIVVLAGGPQNAPNGFDAAKAAGVPITCVAEVSKGDPLPSNVAGSVHVDIRLLGALMVDWAYVQSNGEPGKVWETGATILNTDKIQNEGTLAEWLALGQPAENLMYNGSDLLTFQTKLAPQVQAALIGDPEIKWAWGHWDILNSYVFAGIKAAGKVGQVQTLSWNGLPAALEAVNAGDWSMDIGTSLRCWGWAAFDNCARLSLGQGNVEQNIVVRLIDKKAIDDAGGKMDELSLYGSVYETEYKKLWGVN